MLCNPKKHPLTNKEHPAWQKKLLKGSQKILMRNTKCTLSILLQIWNKPQIILGEILYKHKKYYK